MRRHLGQPNRGFDGFDLTKERTDAAEWVVPPVLEQARRFGADLPLGGVTQGPPRIHVLAHFIDVGGGIVLLFPGGEALPLVEHHFGLSDLFPLLRLRNGRDEPCGATRFDCLLRGLPVLVQFPVHPWALVRRVQDGVVKEWVGHFCLTDTRRLTGQGITLTCGVGCFPAVFLIKLSVLAKTVWAVSSITRQTLEAHCPCHLAIFSRFHGRTFYWSGIGKFKNHATLLLAARL